MVQFRYYAKAEDMQIAPAPAKQDNTVDSEPAHWFPHGRYDRGMFNLLDTAPDTPDFDDNLPTISLDDTVDAVWVIDSIVRKSPTLVNLKERWMGQYAGSPLSYFIFARWAKSVLARSGVDLKSAELPNFDAVADVSVSWRKTDPMVRYQAVPWLLALVKLDRADVMETLFRNLTTTYSENNLTDTSLDAFWNVFARHLYRQYFAQSEEERTGTVWGWIRTKFEAVKPRVGADMPNQSDNEREARSRTLRRLEKYIKELAKADLVADFVAKVDPESLLSAIDQAEKNALSFRDEPAIMLSNMFIFMAYYNAHANRQAAAKLLDWYEDESDKGIPARALVKLHLKKMATHGLDIVSEPTDEPDTPNVTAPESADPESDGSPSMDGNRKRRLLARIFFFFFE